MKINEFELTRCATIALLMSAPMYASGNSELSIPVHVTGSNWNNEICLKHTANSLFTPISGNGLSDLYGYSNGQTYTIEITCQPKVEQCQITSGANGIVTPGMRAVEITCTPKKPMPLVGQKRTHAWALSDSHNSQRFPLLPDVSQAGLSSDYLPIATENLESADKSKWFGSGAQPAQTKDFSLIYRTAATIAPYSFGDDTSSYFNNWAFIRKLISFGGDTNAGSHVLAPHAGWINTAHRAGVKIYGTVFIGQSYSYSSLSSELLGSSYCLDMYDDNSCTYNIPTIDKLTKLATLLKLDGWFLNIESGLGSSYDGPEASALTSHLRRLMRHKFPQLKETNNIDFIVYSHQQNLDIPNLVGDSDIADFGQVVNSELSLDDATGLTDNIVLSKTRFNVNNPQPYLMYLDEPFSRNTIRNEEHPTVRISSAKQTQCQYFNGITNGTWKGFKQYTLAKYPSSTDERELLCGGDVSEPVPTRVIKVPLLNGTSVRIDNGTTCENNSSVPALWYKTCMLEVDAEKSNITISFTGNNNLMSNMTGGGVGQQLIPIVGSKWWSLSKTSADGDPHYFSAYDYLKQGLNTYPCKASSASSKSCTVELPPIEEDWNISAGLYGTPKLRNFIISATYPSFIWGIY